MDDSKNKIRALSIALIVSIIFIGIMGFMLISNGSKKVEVIPEWEAEAISEEKAQSETGYNPEYMQMAIENAVNSKGGPIGAVIVKDGKVISSTSNQIKITGLSFMHAEMSAIKEACETLGTRKLDGCVLYTSAQPCLMCESAIAGSGITTVYYAATLVDMDEHGYDDIAEYEAIQRGENLVKSYAIDVENKLEPLEKKKGKNN